MFLGKLMWVNSCSYHHILHKLSNKKKLKSYNFHFTTIWGHVKMLLAIQTITQRERIIAHMLTLQPSK